MNVLIYLIYFLNYFYKSKHLMEYLFPKHSPYEIIDYSFINLSFNIAYTLDNIININEIQLSHTITKKECLILMFSLLLIFFCFFLKLFNFKYRNYFFRQ